ncbi:MAG: Omp28 family outer membrane lipoprotein [Dysgonomonas sp.]
MKKILYIAAIFSALFFQACDSVSDTDRYIDIPQTPVEKNVLLVDFTGQRCPNCPNAAIVAKTLKEQYGEHLVVVSMHAGDKAVYPTATLKGLKTETGDNYNSYYNIKMHPTAVFDGKSSSISSDIDQWANTVKDYIQTSSPIDIHLSCDYNADTREITITSNINSNEVMQQNLKLQLWVLENKIIAFQQLPDLTVNQSYEHNHIFRDAVNGQWGEDISLVLGDASTYTNKYTLNESWIPENIDIVGFVFNAATKEVYQATQVSIIK